MSRQPKNTGKPLPSAQALPGGRRPRAYETVRKAINIGGLPHVKPTTTVLGPLTGVPVIPRGPIATPSVIAPTTPTTPALGPLTGGFRQGSRTLPSALGPHSLSPTSDLAPEPGYGHEVLPVTPAIRLGQTPMPNTPSPPPSPSEKR